MPKFRYCAEQHNTKTFRVGVAVLLTQRVCLTGLGCCNKKVGAFSNISLPLSKSILDLNRSEIREDKS